ncbi:hypothetical protein [Clostridium estertheticum]|uniref:hypothetical protein n=1 Tax=Clostridium estertheticum TaxID=238834 RepID=UPI00209B4D12|nr:hypothetical protein [Clostridium estertheticum]
MYVKNDDEFSTSPSSYGSIAWGSSFKFIMYKMNSDGRWVHKYYHMLHPDKIDAFHTTRWQKHALIYSNSKPMQENELYTMSGQLMKIVKQTGLPSSYVMNSMCELFGYPKNYFRIGTGDNCDSYWQDMRDNSYIGIGWPKLGNLNLYFESNDVKNDIAAVKHIMQKKLVMNLQQEICLKSLLFH